MVSTTMILVVAALVAQAPSLQVGDDAVLESGGKAKGVFLATDDTSWNSLIDVENSKDTEELALLMAKGKVIRELNGTRVKILKNAFASRLVRIRNGQNPGVEGWIQKEFVKPVPVGSSEIAPVGSLEDAVQETSAKLIALTKTMNKYKDKKLARAKYPQKKREIIAQVANKYHLSDEQILEMLKRLNITDL